MKKRIKSKIVLLLFFACISLVLPAQQERILNYEGFLKLVVENHPISVKSKNIGQFGELQYRSAWGNYDPEINAFFDNKYFNSTNYFTYSNAEIKQQLFSSQYLKAGYDFASGTFINPEQKTGIYGLPYLGFEMALLQGMFIDKRRADVIKSKHFRDYYNAEKEVQLNSLLFESSMLYFDFLFADKEYSINKFFVDLATQRIQLVENLAQVGEKPALDTLEAKILLQTRLYDMQNTLMERNKKNFELNSFLWQNQAPDSSNFNTFSDSLDLYFFKAKKFILSNPGLNDLVNPIVKQYQAKQKVLEVEKKLKRELIKPKLDVSYNLLSSNFNSINPVFGINNYKWGANLSFPLFLRNSRNEFKMADINLKNNLLDLNSKNNEIKFKQKALLTNMEILDNQIQNLQSAALYSKDLVDAERLKFFNGESSLFLLNTRENKWLEYELKLVESKTKYIQTVLKIVYLNGSINSTAWLN